MKLSRFVLLVLIFTLTGSLNVIAKPVKFLVNDEMGRDNVSFTSDAPIELIVGRTNKIKGEIIIDDSLDLKKSSPKVNFQVDLSTIDTGIPLRNEHMRDNFLETKKFPEAVFKVDKITSNSGYKLENGKPLTLIANGSFSVHGITIKKQIPVKITYLKESEATKPRFPSGDIIRIQSNFEIPLAEHKIKRPEVVFQKLADTVIVTIDAFANIKAEQPTKTSN